MRKTVWMATLCLALVACGQNNGKKTASAGKAPVSAEAAAPAGNISVGDALPEFSVTLSDGTAVGTAGLKGAVSVVTFFTATCPDCKFTLPHVQKAYDAFAPKGVRFVNISREVGAAKMAELWQELGLTMPYSAQDDRSVYDLFAEKVIPRVYISDAQGIVRFVHTDSPNPEFPLLEAELNALLLSASHAKTEEVCTDGSCE